MTDTQDREDADSLDDTAVASWSTRGQVRRSTRKRTGIAGAKDAFMKWPVWRRWLTAVPVALVLLLVIVVTIDLAASVGRIHPGVQAAGVDIGGMSTEDAAALLNETLPTHMADPVTVSYETTSWSVAADTIKATADTTTTAADAYLIGRTGGALDRAADRAAAWFSSVSVEVPVSSDASATAAAFGVIASQIDEAPRDATVVIEGTDAKIQSAVPGKKIDEAKLLNQVLAAMVGDDKTVAVDVAVVPVRVTDEGAAQALLDTQKMLSGPVKVTYEAQTWEFTAAEIGKWIEYRIVGDSTESSVSVPGATPATGPAATIDTELLEAYISSQEASKTVTDRVGEAGRIAKDASFKVAGGVVNIVPSQDGVGPDVDALATEMTVVLKGDKPRTVELRTQRVEPKITTADAQAMGIKERISTYTTTYDAGNKPRVNNIHTLADGIDGTLIAPGGTFSFNGSVGPRTAAKGYQEAPAIVNGKLVPQLGGGICQVGTTVFNAVFESGLPVIERKNHSFYISHYPKGRDATVSWGGPDFKFKNDTPNWVLLATGYSNSSLTISLYGTDPGYDVTSATGEWTDMKPHPVKETPDPTLAAGKRIIEDSGVDGRTIVVTRTVKKNGSIVREDKFRSVYKTKEEVVLVGTLPIPGTTPTTAP